MIVNLIAAARRSSDRAGRGGADRSTRRATDRAGLTAAGLDRRTTGCVDALLAEAARPRRASRLEQRERRTIVDCSGDPMFELPWLADGVDLGGLYELSRRAGRRRRSEVPW